jgi:hypothetical protein
MPTSPSSTATSNLAGSRKKLNPAMERSNLLLDFTGQRTRKIGQADSIDAAADCFRKHEYAQTRRCRGV